MVNSEAKRAFGVNPSLFSSNKRRAHFLLTSPTRKAGRGSAKFVIKHGLREGGQKRRFFLNTGNKRLPGFT